MTGGRRGQRNTCVWQRWQGYYQKLIRVSAITWEFCLPITLMFPGLLQKICSKEFVVWRKVFSNKLLSRLSHKGCRLLSSPVLLRNFTIVRKLEQEQKELKMELAQKRLLRTLPDWHFSDTQNMKALGTSLWDWSPHPFLIPSLLRSCRHANETTNGRVVEDTASSLNVNLLQPWSASKQWLLLYLKIFSM